MTTTAAKALSDATKAYTRPVLGIYDAVIMGLLARPVWRCPATLFVNLYDALVSPTTPRSVSVPAIASTTAGPTSAAWRSST